MADKNAIVDNPVDAALEAFKSGTDVEEAVYGTQSTVNPEVPEPVEEENREENSAMDYSKVVEEISQEEEDVDVSESDDESELSLTDSDSDKDEPDQPLESDIEYIQVTDTKGRRKVKIDFSDKDKLKKYVQMAAGARKWQAERDDFKTKLVDTEKEYTELKNDFSKLEKAYESNGIKGLVELLEGKDSYDKFINEVLKQREYEENLSPDEKLRIEQNRILETEKRAKSETEEKYNKLLSELEKTKEQNEVRALESRMHPSFDRYRFSGKLGDKVAEHQLDEALWQQALNRLSEYPDDVELTQAMVDKEFRKVSQNFNKIISKQAENRAKKAISKQKSTATKNVQMKAKKGYTNNKKEKDFAKNMKSGNLGDALRSLMTGEIKL